MRMSSSGRLNAKRAIFSRPLTRTRKPVMMKILCCACLLLIGGPTTLAQTSNSDRCTVAVADPQTKKSAQLGSFQTIIAEEELTTRAFRLARTGLFVVASVFYTDESMVSEKGQDSISLELALSKGKQRDVLHSLSWAEAEMPLSTFDVGRVTTLIRANRRSKLVVMECRKAR